MSKNAQKLIKIGMRSNISRLNIPPMPTLKDVVRAYISNAATFTQIPKQFIDGLQQCSHTLELNIPVRRDDGSKDLFRAWRAHHSIHTLPLKGGVRFSKITTKEEIEAVAILMTLKSACVDIPYGGAAGGIQVDPRELSVRELEILSRRYARELAISGFFSPAIDVLGPDIGSSSREMAWMMDTYMDIYPDDTDAPACITGKPESIEGVPGASEATGLGMYYALREFMSDPQRLANTKLTPSLRDKRIIIEGYGSVGFNFAKTIVENEGATIIGVIEYDGATYNSDGLDIEALNNHFKRHQTVKGFEGGHTFKMGEEVRSKECDILVPAALEATIHLGNVGNVKTKLILEGANMPITPRAEDYLLKNGVTVLPDICVNSGSVIAGYFEYVKNLGRINPGQFSRRWDYKSNESLLRALHESSGLELPEDMTAEFLATNNDMMKLALEDIMCNAVKEMASTAKRLDISYRDAAYVIALERIYQNLRFTSFYSH